MTHRTTALIPIRLGRFFALLAGLWLAGSFACGPLFAQPVRAYSWTGVDPDLDYIVPMHWLRKKALRNTEAMLERALGATTTMPEGHRVLFSWDLHRDMAWHPGDVLRTAGGEVAGCTGKDGAFRHYRSLWWDRGVEQVRARFDHWFERYAAHGGKLDVFVLDFEQGFSYWHLLQLAQDRYPCGINAYLLAIQSDPRFASLRSELGFDDLLKLNDWYKSDEHLRWWAVVHRLMADYIEAAVYEPIRKHFPGVKFSNYGYYYQDPKFKVPDLNGYDRHRYGRGRHVGTHQSRQLYGWIGQLADRPLEGIPVYAATPFNALRFELNKLRAMRLSSPRPVYPWVANKEFENSLFRNNDLYQESIFHIALSGVENLLFWNPLSSAMPSTPASNRLLNDLLVELDQVTGGLPIDSGYNAPMPWSQSYILTEGAVGGCRLWRFTPLLAEGEILDATILQRDPARFQVGDTEVSIDDGQIFELARSNSKAGIWVRQRDCSVGANPKAAANP